MAQRGVRFLSGLLILLGLAVPAGAAERLCDPAGEDCRAILLDHIRAETEGIDVAFWFMTDARYSNELVNKARQGVAVRVLVDPRSSEPMNRQILDQLASAGIPMRRRTASGILHWKMMLFAGQRIVQFSGANYSPDAFRPQVPYSNYTDESIFFTDDLGLVQSFMRRFDDLWTNTRTYADYANIAGPLTRRYPEYDLHPDLNFPPGQSYRTRSIAAYRAEPAGIDVIMYRITDRAQADAMIAAVGRGIPVRVITEPLQYRDPKRLWHSLQVDRMHMAGVQIRHRAHEGLNHQKSVILRGQGLVIFGSSNWTSSSSDSQEEHNYFTTKGWILQWFAAQFDRKWNNLGPAVETQPFTPLPPDAPRYTRPVAGATGVPTKTALVFDAGPFAHTYDIYFGTTAEPPLLEADAALGPTPRPRDPRRYALPELAPGTTYYWRVVARTAARLEKGQAVSTFTTATVPPPAPAPEPPPPPPPAPAPAACVGVPPAPGWVCVGAGWVPADHPLAAAAPPLPPPAPAPPSAPPPPPPTAPPPAPPTSGCPGVPPAPGWACVGGGWVPADHPLAIAAPAGAPSAPPPAPVPPPAPPAQGCPGVPPAAGWLCINGGWVPADHPLAR